MFSTMTKSLLNTPSNSTQTKVIGRVHDVNNRLVKMRLKPCNEVKILKLSEEKYRLVLQ